MVMRQFLYKILSNDFIPVRSKASKCLFVYISVIPNQGPGGPHRGGIRGTRREKCLMGGIGEGTRQSHSQVTI